MKYSGSIFLKIAVPIAAAAVLALSVVFFYTLYLPKKYEDFVCESAAEFGVEEELIFAVIRTESNFRSDAVSRAGAVGVMQLMPSTAVFIGQALGEAPDLADARENIRAGTWYLRYLLDKFGDRTLAVAAYNAGEGTVRGWLREGICNADGRSPSFPYPETDRYVRLVKKFYKWYNFCYF